MGKDWPDSLLPYYPIRMLQTPEVPWVWGWRVPLSSGAREEGQSPTSMVRQPAALPEPAVRVSPALGCHSKELAFPDATLVLSCRLTSAAPH